MDELRIRVFGGLEVRSGDTLLPRFPTHSSRSLFAFLVRNRSRPFHRDVLCGRFWGERPDVEARKLLRTALWRIRSVIEPDETDRGTLLRVEGPSVGFTSDARVWVDAEEFDQCLTALGGRDAGGLSELDADRLLRAASLYRGDLLEGNYDEWCLLERERLEQRFLTALERLVSYHQSRHQWLETITWCREILRRDPLREHVHRAIMRSHRAMGDRPLALRQYEVLCEVLAEELGIEPMEETRRLHRSLRGDQETEEGAGTEVRTPPQDSERGDLISSQVDEALEVVYALAGQLERARTALRS